MVEPWVKDMAEDALPANFIAAVKQDRWLRANPRYGCIVLL